MSSLNSEFSMTNLGPLHYLLGIVVHRHDTHMFLSQEKCATKILKYAHMSNCKPVSTPVYTKSKLGAYCGPLISNPILYRSLARALQYLTFTRPDISYAVQQVCLYMHAPCEPHFVALKRILRYLQGTLSHGLYLYPSSPTELTAYTNADLGGCPETRRSTSGYCVFLNDILSRGLLNDNLLFPDLVLRPNTGVLLMSLLNLVGYAICLLNYIALYVAPPLFIVIM